MNELSTNFDYRICDAQHLERITQVLRREFKGANVSSETVRRVFLDTFDWRLFHSGFSLEYVQHGSAQQLILTSSKTNDAAIVLTLSKAPRFAIDLPSGRIKSVLGPLIEMRALLPAVKFTTERAVWRVTNQDDKTVFRIHIDRSRLGSRKHLAPRLQARPVLGYAKWAKRTHAVLRGKLHLKPASVCLYQEVLSKAGLDPHDIYPLMPPVVDAQDRADITCKHTLESYAAVLDVNLPGILDDIDSECLHDFRVAVRRTRSVLKQASGIFPSRTIGRFKQEFGWLGKATSALRDYDVYLLDFDDYEAMLEEPFRSDLEPLRGFLEQTRTEELEKLIASLNSRRYARLMHSWRRFLEQPVPKRTVLADATRVTEEIANERIWKTYKKVVRQGRRIKPDTAEEALHELRKTCKSFRYVIELYRPVYPEKSVRTVITALKRLQDNLGRVQDFDVQSTTLGHFSVTLGDYVAEPAATNRAIDKLVKRLNKQQREARAEFHERFAEFDSGANRTVIRKLFHASAKSVSR